MSDKLRVLVWDMNTEHEEDEDYPVHVAVTLGTALQQLAHLTVQVQLVPKRGEGKAMDVPIGELTISEVHRNEQSLSAVDSFRAKCWAGWVKVKGACFGDSSSTEQHNEQQPFLLAPFEWLRPPLFPSVEEQEFTCSRTQQALHPPVNWAGKDLEAQTMDENKPSPAQLAPSTQPTLYVLTWRLRQAPVVPSAVADAIHEARRIETHRQPGGRRPLDFWRHPCVLLLVRDRDNGFNHDIELQAFMRQQEAACERDSRLSKFISSALMLALKAQQVCKQEYNAVRLRWLADQAARAYPHCELRSVTRVGRYAAVTSNGQPLTALRLSGSHRCCLCCTTCVCADLAALLMNAVLPVMIMTARCLQNLRGRSVMLVVAVPVLMLTSLWYRCRNWTPLPVTNDMVEP
jgi:hypothetical protein